MWSEVVERQYFNGGAIVIGGREMWLNTRMQSLTPPLTFQDLSPISYQLYDDPKIRLTIQEEFHGKN